MTAARNPDSWLTARRLVAHAGVLAICLWSIYLWSLATPGLRDRNGNLKGTDFLHFYVLGSLAAGHRGADLYDMNAQDAVVTRRVPAAKGIRYLPLYPPQVSLFFTPFARLSYVRALALWWTFSVVVYGVCCFSIWRACPNLRDYRSVVLIAALAFPGFFHLIAWGQTSAVALGCFTLMWFQLRSGRNFLAGIALGCLILKPQLGVAAAVIFISLGSWKIVAGAVVSAAAQLATAVLFYGIAPFRQWMFELTHLGSVLPWLEPRPYQTYSLRTFWSMLIAWPHIANALWFVSTIAFLGITIALWKSGPRVPLAVRYPALLMTTVLVAPHLTVYDLVILAPAFLLLADWMAGQPGQARPRSLGTLLYLVYTLPLLAPLVRWTHVQYAVIAMGATICLIYAKSREMAGVENQLHAAEVR